MRAWTTAGFGLAALIAMCGPAVAAGDPVAVQAKADDERCMECHGKQGQGQGEGHGDAADARPPGIAGKPANHLETQLRQDRSGQRKHDLMSRVARDLSDQDILDLAAYLASLP